MRRDLNDFPWATFPIARRDQLLATPNAVSVREGAKSGALAAGGKFIDLSYCEVQRPKPSVQPAELRRQEQTAAEPG